MQRPLDSYVGWYELTPNRVLAVTRDGDRLFVQETGRPKFEVTAHGADAFSGDHDDLVIFLRDGQAKVTQVLLQEPVSGARLAPRVAAARAKTDRGGIRAAHCRSPGSVQGSDPAAGQQGGDPARDRRPATRRTEL